MEQIINSNFQALIKLLPRDSKVEVIGKTLLVTKWNWDYLNCLEFQKASQELVRNNRELKVYIFCNHPHCFTLGRGNERGREDLIEFDPLFEEKLSFPIYKIHRGGGITFHYPGQWIFYPIVNISAKYTLDDHMCWLLKSTKEVLKSYFGLEKAMAAKKLMGVWLERKKLASIGVGLNRFVTEHGLALNLINDQKMFNELTMINPCGMDAQTYLSVDKVINSQENLLNEFHKNYLIELRKKL